MIDKFHIYEKKKVVKKSEKDAVEDKFKKEKDRIEKKRKELTEINQSDDTVQIKSARSKIKRVEIEMVEKEIEIAKLRDKKIKYDKDLKDARKNEKDKK